MHFALSAAIVLLTSLTAADTAPPSLIPKPITCKVLTGTLTLPSTPIIAPDPNDDDAIRIAQTFAELLRRDLHLSAAIDPGADASVHLTRKDADRNLGPEGYTLEITPEAVTIRAPEPAGLFYGLQTLRQLLPATPSDTYTLPCVRITDKPRFPWRGLMLDCSRTFLRMDYLRRYVDRLAAHKMNVLHLHLTDDQGWRVQIDKHPRLTDIGANFDPACPGEVSGYYTKQELRDLVRYAQERFVTIVPEIEMPSHALAVLVSYPDLSCRGDAYRILPFSMMLDGTGPVKTPYGVLCAGNDRTFEVMQDVIDEVIDIFPSQYIHIGGDECPKEFWKSCPKCQARMKAENLADENELQSYFVKRIEKYINAKGRILLGWDEILEGGLAPNAAVMSWRGINGGIEAARAGHPVVMSPTTHCYFDYDHLGFPLRNVYAYDPIPSELTTDQGQRVLGAQGNMWTHIARTETDIDAQIFPRLVALAEVTWSPKDLRDWPDFETRMKTHYARLDAQGVAYYREAVAPSLAIAPGETPWLVFEGKPYTLANGRWEQRPGDIEKLAFTPDGKAYALGKQKREGGNEVLAWDGAAWQPVPSETGAVYLAAAPDGALWVVDDANRVRVYANGQWTPRPEQLHCVAIASDGAMWALSPTALAGGFDVLQRTEGEWHSLGNGSSAVDIAAVPGALWAVNSLGAVFVRRDNAWQGQATNVRVLAASPDGALYGLTPEPRGVSWQLRKYDQGRWLPQGAPFPQP